MTHPSPHPQPAPFGAAAPPKPPRKRLPTLAWLGITLGALLVGVCLGGVAGGAVAGDDPGPAPGQRQAPAEPAAEKPDPADPAFPEPEPDDFTLSIKTLEKECFGSAGCLIDFRIELAYDGPDLDPSVTYEITYEVAGGEDPYINTLTATGDRYSTEETESVSTASDVDLVAEVTNVSEL